MNGILEVTLDFRDFNITILAGHHAFGNFAEIIAVCTMDPIRDLTNLSLLMGRFRCVGPKMKYRVKQPLILYTAIKPHTRKQ